MDQVIERKTKAETIRATARFLGITNFEAAFIWAIEHGEVDGDIVIVDDDGTERTSLE
jgi:hypothetical protein